MFQNAVLSDLDRHELSLLAERIVEAEEGETVTAGQIEEWVGSWFTEGELPPPEPPPRIRR